MDGLVIAPAAVGDAHDWVQMRVALWPTGSETEHADEIEAEMRHSAGLNLIARLHGAAVGFAEASIRHDYVNGCDTSPVAFIEGLYVAPAFRRRGIAGRLVGEIEAWAQAQGFAELASDAPLDNIASQAMHEALGLLETQRVVYFRKPLG